MGTKQRCHTKLFGALVAAAMSFSAAAFTTNFWQGADGGSWTNPDNWSLGRVPTDDDNTVLTDMGGPYSIEVEGDQTIYCLMVGLETEATVQGTVTLTGSGSITATGKKENYIRPKRGLIVNGPDIHLDNGNLMIYGPLIVKSNSTMTSAGYFTFWINSPSLLVEEYGKVDVALGIRCRSTSPITVAGGSLTAPSIGHYSTYRDAIRISLTGGELTLADMDLKASSWITMSGGTLKATSSIALEDSVTLTLTGGTIVLPQPSFPQRIVSENNGATLEYITANHIVDGPITDRSVLEGLNGASLTVKSNSSDAMNVFTQDGETVTVDGQLSVSNGYITCTNVATLTSEYPMFVKGFRTTSALGLLTIHTPTMIVCNTAQPFVSGGEGRYFFLEGPMTIRPTANLTRSTSRSFYAQLSGDFIIDQHDWYDPSIVRSMDLRGFGAKDAATLTLRGGGEFWLMTSRSGSPFSRVTLEEGGTLTLATLGTGNDFGPFHTEELVLEANTMVNIPAGSNAIHAVKWTVDPTAVINVVFPEGIATDAKGVLCDIGGNFTPAAGQIRLVGATEGWGLIEQNGSWAVTNAAMDVTRESEYEWTGGGANKLSENPDNWGGTRPMESKTYIFGWEDGGATVNFHCFFRTTDTDDANGTTIQGIKFRNTAVKSFTIGGTAQITYNNSGEWASSAVYSLSPVAQCYFGGQIRGLHPSFCASAEGPLIIKTASDFAKRDAVGQIRVSGDVRIGNTVTFPQLNIYRYGNNCGHLVCGTRLSVLNGGSLTFTNQATAFSQSWTGLRVEAGGSLTFNGGSSAFYRWSCAKGSTSYAGPAKHTIDGTLNINVPFQGGNHQGYGGCGDLHLSTIQPYQTASKISFGDALNVYPSQDWVTTADGADFPLTVKVFGTPTIHLAANWKYGPAEGSTPVSEAADRAAMITGGSTLTVDAGGNTATFEDPVAGYGTLAITNGTLRATGGTASSLGIVMKAGGVFEPVAGQTLRSVRCENGGVLRLTAFEPVTVKENVNLGEINLAWPANLSLAGSPRWRTVFVSKTGFTGEFASTSKACVSRVVETEDGFALQLKRVDGTVISFR